jgi:hypothetical protein
LNDKGISKFKIDADLDLFDLEINLVTEFSVLVVRALHSPHV